MIFLYLFITFFEIGLFGFGGGYGQDLSASTPPPIVAIRQSRTLVMEYRLPSSARQRQPLHWYCPR